LEKGGSQTFSRFLSVDPGSYTPAPTLTPPACRVVMRGLAN